MEYDYKNAYLATLIISFSVLYIHSCIYYVEVLYVWDLLIFSQCAIKDVNNPNPIEITGVFKERTHRAQ